MQVIFESKSPAQPGRIAQAQGHHCGLAEYAAKEAELPQVELAQLVMEGLQQGRKSRLRVLWVPVTSCNQLQQPQTRKKLGLGD